MSLQEISQLRANSLFLLGPKPRLCVWHAKSVELGGDGDRANAAAGGVIRRGGAAPRHHAGLQPSRTPPPAASGIQTTPNQGGRRGPPGATTGHPGPLRAPPGARRGSGRAGPRLAPAPPRPAPHPIHMYSMGSGGGRRGGGAPSRSGWALFLLLGAARLGLVGVWLRVLGNHAGSLSPFSSFSFFRHPILWGALRWGLLIFVASEGRGAVCGVVGFGCLVFAGHAMDAEVQ